MEMKKLFFYLTAIAAILLISCSDENPPIDNILPYEAKTLLILNEGDFQNNSTLSMYDLSTSAQTRDIFETANNRELGALANNMILYGSKLYIVMNLSGTIEVVNPLTGKSIKRIDMKNENNENKEPRFITAYKDKIYITSTFDDTVTRIDTTTLNIEATVTVGLDPEGIIAGNGKLYVANSGGWSGFNNTLSIIDIETFSVVDEIEVGLNPTYLDIDNKGNIYISAFGNFVDAPALFQKYDPITGVVTTIEDISSPGKFLIHNNKAYIIQGSYGNSYNVLVYDCDTGKVITNSFITDGTQIELIYSLSIDKKTGDLFIIESDYILDGSVYCFDKHGKRKYKINEVGLNPNTVIVL